MFIITLKGVNWPMRIGGIFPAVGLVSLGRLVAAVGARRAYPKLAEIVAETKAEMRRGRQDQSSFLHSARNKPPVESYTLRHRSGLVQLQTSFLVD